MKTKTNKLLSLMIVIIPLLCFGQDYNHEELTKKCILLAFLDGASTSPIQSLDSIYKEYDVREAKVYGSISCYVFVVNRHPGYDTSCPYYCLYDLNTNLLYRLSGFRNNDFVYFVNNFIFNDGISYPRWHHAYTRKYKIRYALKNFSIEGLDFRYMYRLYYKHANRSERKRYSDRNSCYFKTIIYSY